MSFKFEEKSSLEEEGKGLRDIIKRVVQKLLEVEGVEDAQGYSKGWHDAIIFALGAIEEESGVTIEEILNPKCK